MHPFNVVKKWDAYRVYLLLEAIFAFGFAIIATNNIVYHARGVGLDPLQLVLVGTVLEVTVFLFEVPTGVMADVYSRRLSVIVGALLTGLGFMIEGAFPSYGALLLASVVWGLGATFSSGATQAWITDEIGEDRAAQAFIRGSQVGTVAGLAGTVLSGLLASIALNLPSLLGGALIVGLGLFLLLVMPEDGFTRASHEERESWRTMLATTRAGLRLVRLRPVLLTILGVSLFWGLHSEGFDRLWQKHLLDNFTMPWFEPVVWFSILGVIGSLIYLPLSEFARRRVDTTSARGASRALLLCYGGVVGGMFVFALSGNLWLALAANMAGGMMRGLSGPFYGAWLNQNVDSSVRATMFSMSGQMNAIGQIGGGPIVGAIGQRLGVRFALSASGLLLLPILPLIGRTLRREPLAAEPEAAEAQAAAR